MERQRRAEERVRADRERAAAHRVPQPPADRPGGLPGLPGLPGLRGRAAEAVERGEDVGHRRVGHVVRLRLDVQDDLRRQAVGQQVVDQHEVRQ